MRWRQDKDTGEFIPVDEAARNSDGVAIQGPIEPFVSPIDGTVITGRKAYREHCKKHNVVPSAEFSASYYQEQAKKRADYFEGRRAKEESLQTKRMMYEAIVRAERNGQ